ncbi:MAG: ABC transporter ATP-binding protein [Actinomycetota bacterium]|nr:ABC transporter ATP-binding protein [Actinomycetota bacterium]
MTDQARPVLRGGPGGPAVVLDGLVKAFNGRLAVDHLSLQIPAGSVYGMLGPNGAGKTTSMLMVSGLMRPDAGSVQVLGHDVWSDPAGAKALFGVSPDGLRLFDMLSAAELLRYVGELRSMPGPVIAQRSAELLHVLGLSEAANVVVADFSAGMTKKIGLACAMLHAPRLLILDEPFESVDPVSAQTMRGVIARYVAGGGTVVISSHVMELVETVCDHVAVIVAGRVLAAGRTDDVRGGISLHQRFLDLVGAGPAGDFDGGLAWLRS